MSKEVTIIQRRMVRYRVTLFESMRKRLAEKDVMLEIIYGTPTCDDILRHDEGLLEWGLRIPCRYINLGNLQIVLQRIPKDFLKAQDLVILPHENKFLFNYWVLLRERQKRKRMRLAFFGHGANFQATENNNYRNKLRSWTARKVDWWFAYTPLSVEKIIEYRFPEDHITCLNNAVDTSNLIQWRESISPDELEALSVSLGLRGKKVGIFIGSLYREKRLNFLFSASDRIHRKLEDFELLMIGDGPLRNQVRDYASMRPWVRWVGAKRGREKALHLALGQVMLNSGLTGLSLFDSFAMGLPMVATECYIQPPEIVYLDPGRNGMMVPNDEEAFANGVLELLADPSRRKKMAEVCKKECDHYSLDKMVDNFCEGILQALKL